jgi:glycosyltransferase involved in cell wall biosynthesis
VNQVTSDVQGLVLVNGSHSSVQGPRARALFGDSARIFYKTRGRLGSVPEAARAIVDRRGGWIYCIDLGLPAAPLAALLRRAGTRLIYEIGDPSAVLFEKQERPRIEVEIARRLEVALPKAADALVFRGSYLLEGFHKEASSRGVTLPPSHFVPDGVAPDVIRPERNSERVKALRRAHALGDAFVVGVVGSIHYNPRTQTCYGSELVEALARLREHPHIRGIVVGDGSGLPYLRRRVEALGLADRVLLVGRVPHSEVPAWLSVLDVGLSTQTNDAIGWGRTTAKLPEYLAAGVVVVCTDVGEAHRLLGASIQTLPFDGSHDAGYPSRLAQRLAELSMMDLAPLRERNRALALEHFDYGVLQRRLASVLAGTAR